MMVMSSITSTVMLVGKMTAHDDADDDENGACGTVI